MWEWFQGPGRVFREPLPGSTNYLSAYDKQGNLLRARRNQQEDPEDQDELDQDEDAIVQRELDQGLDDVERENRAIDRATKRSAREEIEERGGIPPERQGDMRPYPLNQSFKSQPVLSEDLREQLYVQVVHYRHDVSSVAATFGVDIRRVAAVVRLKTIEKQWEEEVSFLPSDHLSRRRCCPDDSNFQYSISLQDNYMVTHKALRASLILQHYAFLKKTIRTHSTSSC